MEPLNGFLFWRANVTQRNETRWFWFDGMKRFPRLPQVGTMTMARNSNSGHSNECANWIDAALVCTAVEHSQRIQADATKMCCACFPLQQNIIYTMYSLLLSATANIQPRHARIVITSHILLRRPRINMNMLKVLPAHLPRRPRTSIHVIQLLLAAAKSISIPLLLRDLRNNIQILQTRHLHKPAQRLHCSELVEIACDNNRSILILLQDLGDERARDFSLTSAAVDAAVDGRTSVALQRGRAAFACPVVVDGEEGARAVDHFPVRDDGLAGVAERLAVVDAARVEAKRWPRKDFVDVGGVAWVGVLEAHFAGVVKVRGLDVAAGGAAVLVVDWVDVDVQVVYAGDVADGLGERGEGQVGVGHAVVCFAGVVLDFLQEHDRGRVEVVDDVLGDEWDAGVVGSEVLDVVVAKGKAIAASV
jgi:hypothetical protein